jgi:hypothetical protein
MSLSVVGSTKLLCGVVVSLPVVPPQPTSITVKTRQIVLKINGLISSLTSQNE